MNTDSLVSIIIPTYNRSALLAEAIQSVISQTYRPIECIVVDDGSTDSTHEVLSKIRITDISCPNEDRRASFTLKYIFQQNTGAQLARNTGTAAASGEFIQYLDSDDLLYPGKISAQIEFFALHPDCDAVFGDWEKGTIDVKEKVVAYKSDDLIAQFLTDKCIANFAMLIRKQLVKKIGDWDVNIKRNQEIDFHLRGILAGGKFEYQTGINGLWRQHGAERIANRANLFQAIQFYQKWERTLSEKDLLSDEIRSGLARNYMWFLGEYSRSSYKEMIAVLIELHRLNPTNPIFLSAKFRFLKKLCGFKIAAGAWLYRYKKVILKKSHKVITVFN